MTGSIGHWTVKGLVEEVARTERFAGGGAVAAMSLAGAAATAELVFQLSHRRRDLTDQQTASLSNAIEEARELRSRFLTAIDEDISSLTELMDAQRQLRRARKATGVDTPAEVTERMRLAVDSAIATPMGVADDASKLLNHIEQAQGLARPFTASDLGAAAATIQGAITSLLLMAEVNLGMLDDQQQAERLRNEIEERSSQAAQQANAIISGTRRVIHNGADQGD